MTIRIYANSLCALHDMGEGHIEQPARYHVVEQALKQAFPHPSLWHDCKAAKREDLLRVHQASLVDMALRFDENIEVNNSLTLAYDLTLKQHSVPAALHAAGGALQAISDVMQGKAKRGFVISRPPGHHAEPDEAMGFCLFNNIALAAACATDHYGLERIAILDFDVHHGNGTQAMAWDRKGWFFASSHQMPLYPGSGKPDERGHYNQIHNLPLMAGTGGEAILTAWQDHIIPALRAFRPQRIFISAGFDAHRLDPLGGLAMENQDYASLTQMLCDVADEYADGRVVSVLEGGYHLDALAQSTAAHVQALAKA